MDYVLAASDAYLTLPGAQGGDHSRRRQYAAAALTGDRIARQAIMYGRRLECDSPEGRLICDEIASPETMDRALAGVIEGLTSAGVVSAVANRRQFRVVQEPIDTFLSYLAVYGREQAYCHFSPALIANLEQHWGRAKSQGYKGTLQARRSPGRPTGAPAMTIATTDPGAVTAAPGPNLHRVRRGRAEAPVGSSSSPASAIRWAGTAAPTLRWSRGRAPICGSRCLHEVARRQHGCFPPRARLSCASLLGTASSFATAR